MSVYYKYSPPVAKLIAENNSLRTLTYIDLLPVVGVFWIALKLGAFTTVTFIMILFAIGLIGFAGFRKY